MSKEEKIKSFDPNGMASGNQLFGLPFNETESDIVILPVPWDVTVSYASGTAKAPAAIVKASSQVDLFDNDVQDAWKRGIYLKKIDKKIQKQSKELRGKVLEYLSFLEKGETIEKNKGMRKLVEKINAAGEDLKEHVYKEMTSLLSSGKLPALLGGDHSTPLGFMKALAGFYSEYGILQIDAHCDLRNAYEGFKYSHASIMYNALQIHEVKKLVQVGVRDFCQEEMEMIHNSDGRIKVFLDADLKRMMYEGESWKLICEKIVHQLPQHVYVSFDIDGLDPKLAPNTGTPVPGGLEFEQAAYLILNVARSGRKIIGFDLNEVVPGDHEWDANVGARMLYKLSNLMGLSHQLFKKISAGGEVEFPRNDEKIINVINEE